MLTCHILHVGHDLLYTANFPLLDVQEERKVFQGVIEYEKLIQKSGLEHLFKCS